ncbi:MAG: tetratricopeptide repeat protein [Betaproteobacteria bacterium]|nr:tetratricopeptide repeat protein [Betaproteobacteria bacterium]
MRMEHCWFRWLLAVSWFIFAFVPAHAQTQTDSDRALAIYEEGKKLYDAGDFGGARAKFNQAIKIEPANPRWHYNIGLAHRQMDNVNAARDSLMKARELDPAYKRDEINQKLAAMGFEPATGAAMPARSHASSHPDNASFINWMLAGLSVFVVGFAWFVVKRVRQGWSYNSAAKAASGNEPPPDAAEVAAIGHRLARAAQQLVQVEHALRFTEHADLRSQLDHATQLEQDLHERLAAARTGDASAFRKAGRAIAELVDSASRAADLSKQVFGSAALAAGGQRIACYFCARPLANPDYRRSVTIKRGDTRARVVSCPGCAGQAKRGEAPAVLVAEDGKTHWSEIPGFDPYAARHSALNGVPPMPAWRYAPQRSFGELALLAAGSALAGGAIASMQRPDLTAADEPLLDLDAAQEAGLAQEAARAVAKRALAQRGEQSSTDHS